MNTASGTFVSEYARYQQWLQGFVSGYNAAHSSADEQQKQVDGIDLAGMDLWMRNWCNKHPTKTVFAGAVAFIEEIRGDAVRVGSDDRHQEDARPTAA